MTRALSTEAESVASSVEISVVIPVFNGSTTVGDVVDRIADALDKRRFEVVLVDDGSSDESWDVIGELSNRPYVRGLRMLKNYGQHVAVVAGLAEARGAWVATIDDDGENDPTNIVQLIDIAIGGDHDLVFADRVGRHAPVGRRIASRIVNRLVIRVFRAPDSLVVSNFRVMTNDVAKRIAADATQYPYVNGLALEYSGRPASVPVEHGQRQGHGSRYSLRSLFRLLSDILFSYSIWAYRLLLVSALGAIGVSGLFSAIALTRAAFNETAAPGWASIVLLFSVMSAANLLALLVIGEYVIRSLRQSRAPSRYVVSAER